MTMRRVLAFATALFLALASFPLVASAEDQSVLGQRAGSAIAGFSGQASVVIVDLGAGYRYSYDESRVVPAASLYKLGVMVEAYRRVAEGSLSLGDTVTVTDDDLEDDGYITPSGTDLSMQDAIERMITVSDNSSARALTRVLDAHRVNDTMRSYGLKDTRINSVLPDVEQTAPYNTTTARDIANLFVGLSRGTVVGPSWSAQMLEVLGRQTINDRLPVELPGGVSIAHKTGDLDGVSHDAGLITGPFGRRVVVMLTTGATSYDDVVSLAEQLGAVACQSVPDDFAARFTRPPAPAIVAPGSKLNIDTTVRNASGSTWSADTYLVQRLRTPTTVREIQRIPLPPAGPGMLLPMSLRVAAPLDPGVYVIEVEVIDPARGGTGNVLSVVINVQPGAASVGIPGTDPQSAAAVTTH